MSDIVFLILTLLGLILAVLALGYLLYALLRPEDL
jgi:K+-transporting ATPase KdpF subunit